MWKHRMQSKLLDKSQLALHPMAGYIVCWGKQEDKEVSSHSTNPFVL
jgi:hypothetical protein